MKVVLYRALRRSCRITITELAREVGITSQRLSQIEQHPLGYKPENPERLIVVLEDAVKRQLSICEKTLEQCKIMRDSMFDYVEESEVSNL